VADALLTVVVPTHERPDDLRRCLEALAGLEDPVDVVVVDSASRPPCHEIVESFAGRIPRLRYAYETAPGLNRARNRGLAESACELIAFVDDDAAVAPDWARRIATPFADPLVGVVGGTCRPRFETMRPSWLSSRLLQFAGITRIGSLPREARSTAEYPFGANMCFRRAAVVEAGGFQPGLDRTGTSLLSGGDSEAIDRLRARGWRIWLQPDAVVDHSVAAERCESRYYWRRLWWQGVSRARQERSLRVALRLIAAAPVRLVLWLVTRDRVYLYRVAETAGYLVDASNPRAARP
jgi:cellulose synthase/poly-beta-1,6-N-acetylglucosamine synthase-like glycosyltransferase